MNNKFKNIKPIECIKEIHSIIKQDKLQFNWSTLNLYHYTSGQGLKSIIENKELWLTKSEFLNDKDEIQYTLEVVNNIVDNFTSDEIIEEEEIFKIWIEKCLSDSILKFDFYILSTSINGDSNLLWSNYANNDGYNIEFQYPDLPVAINKVFSHNLFKNGVQPYLVIYDKKMHEELLEDEIKNLYKIFLYFYKNGENIEEAFNKYSFQNIANILIYSLFFKSKCFSQEEEFRLAILMSSKDDDSIKYHCKFNNGVFIPYIKVPIVDENGKLPISSITIGPKNNLDIAEIGLRHFLDMNGLDYVNIKKSEIPYRY